MSVTLLFVILFVFLAVFLLVQALVVPAFGEGKQMRRLLQQRLASIEDDSEQGAVISLLRQDYLTTLTPSQRWLEELPGMTRLREMIQQAGLETQAWKVVFSSFVFALIAGVTAALVFPFPILGLVAAVVAGAIPYFRVVFARARRMDQFERELPEAIDLVKRALRAGQPFSVAIKLVADDVEGPVGKEFQTTSADMAYGNDPRRALLALLTRMPSVALTGFVTAVLLQRETGGNLVEVLEQISAVIRGRYRFQRRVRTLSAEGRMSAWVLSMVPVVLVVILTIVSPDYLPVLFKTDMGQKLMLGSSIMMCVGILWMRKIIQIKF